MSEIPHSHSEQSKEKISSSLRQLWAERLKRKRSREKLYFSWAESVAEAARRGGINEEELNWDSYERFKEEIASRQLQCAAKKAKGKELKKIQAEKRVRKRVEKMASFVQKKMEHKKKAEPRAKQKWRMSSKGREAKEELALSREPNLSDKLIKIHGKNLMDGPSGSQVGVMTYLQSALESFDIESIKREQKRNTVSLADQIQAAKSKRVQIVADGSAVANIQCRRLNSSNIPT